jgi:2-iminobutanoate/2-iminopropanoate deaminase
MVPRDPATNNLVVGDITLSATRIFDNLEAILKAEGLTFRDVVKVTVYMVNLDDFAKMNEVMASRFGDHRPARTTVQVAKLPGGAPLEIDVVARAKP